MMPINPPPGGGLAPASPEVRGQSVDLSNCARVADAYRAVLQHHLVDVFALTGEESLWVGYHLADILAPLDAVTATAVPLAVRQELLDGTFSQLVTQIEADARVQHPIQADASVAAASREEWVAAIMSSIRRCWTLRPMAEATMAGRIGGLLAELGIGDRDNPRGSLVVPADLRQLLSTPPVRG